MVVRLGSFKFLAGVNHSRGVRGGMSQPPAPTSRILQHQTVVVLQIVGGRLRARAGRVDRFRRAAHSLKSNASTFGAVRLAAMARDFELAGLGSDPARDIAAIAAIEAELSDAAVALKALCNG